ncbi:MAG: integrase [Paracoccus denitrificans]|nr:MAG: integrase [Paracoccus denitrificans]PZO84796.1 MAG: integrase [Paracoccus denitrificans]
MAKSKGLTAASVKAKKEPGQYADGGGLYLQVTSSGTRSWLFRFTILGRARGMGLGSCDLMTLSEARETAGDLRKKVRQGIDPIDERDRAAAQAKLERESRIDFSEAVDRYLSIKLVELGNPKHRKQWTETLLKYAIPVLGQRWVDELQVHDVLSVLEPIWAEKTETASRLRSRIESVLSWATVAGFRQGENPARWKGNLSELLPKPSAVTKPTNHPAVALQDLPAWWSALLSAEGQGAMALRLLVLCASRSQEVRGARWTEFDLEKRMWTIPADRMKAKREHRVPLSHSAIKLLELLPRFVGNDLLFPSAKGTALSDMTLSKVMRTMHAKQIDVDGIGWVDQTNKRPAVPHGLRSTFRDWAAVEGIERDIAEIALAHNVGDKVERAYRRNDMVLRRREVMDQWAEACAGRANSF